MHSKQTTRSNGHGSFWKLKGASKAVVPKESQYEVRWQRDIKKSDHVAFLQPMATTLYFILDAWEAAKGL